MSQPELVIFDCDGTLVDSEIIAGQVDTALLAEAGVKISVEEFNERYAGLTFGEAVMRVEGDFKVPLQASIIDRSKAILDRRLAEVGRTGLKPLFGDHVYSARSIPSGRPKPAPDVFLYAAEKLKADPRRCFVLEDSVHGITAAKRAGMRVIGFTGGAHTWPGHADALTEAGAETVIRRWSNLDAVLSALSEWSEDRA